MYGSYHPLRYPHIPNLNKKHLFLNGSKVLTNSITAWEEYLRYTNSDRMTALTIDFTRVYTVLLVLEVAFRNE